MIMGRGNRADDDDDDDGDDEGDDWDDAGTQGVCGLAWEWMEADVLKKEREKKTANGDRQVAICGQVKKKRRAVVLMMDEKSKMRPATAKCDLNLSD